VTVISTSYSARSRLVGDERRRNSTLCKAIAGAFANSGDYFSTESGRFRAARDALKAGHLHGVSGDAPGSHMTAGKNIELKTRKG